MSVNRLALAVRGLVGLCASLAVCGNSLAAMSFDGDYPAANHYMAEGSIGSAVALAGVSPAVKNFGVSGIWSTTWRDTVLPAVLAAQPDLAILYLGQNQLTIPSQSQAHKDCISAMVANGTFVLVVPVFQCAGNAQQISAYNREIKAHCQLFPGGCRYLGEAYPAVMDESAATPVFKTGFSDDNIHFNALGAYNFGLLVLAPIFTKVFPAKVLVQSDADRFNFDATSNQLLGNPLFIGSYATAAANCNGNVANDWLVTAPAGFTMACDVLPANGGVGKKQQLSITSGGAGFITLQSGYFNTRWTTGDILAAASRLRIDSAVNVVRQIMYLQDAGSSQYWNNTFVQTSKMPNARQEYLAAQTLPRKWTNAGSTQLIYLVQFSAVGAALVEAETAQVLKNP